jgi:hypothetical protein
MTKHYRCYRCQSIVSFEKVSFGYFAYCQMHDEDLFKFETYYE